MIILDGGSLDTEFMNQNSWSPCHVLGALTQVSSSPCGNISHVGASPCGSLDCVFDEHTRETRAAAKQAGGFNFSSH